MPLPLTAACDVSSLPAKRGLLMDGFGKGYWGCVAGMNSRRSANARLEYLCDLRHQKQMRQDAGGIMILFFLPVLALIALIIAGIVFAAAFVFVRKPSVTQNRFGSETATRNPLVAIMSGFRRIFDFRGRANRMDFWIFAIFTGVMCFIALILSIFLLLARHEDPIYSALWILLIIPAMAIPSLSVAVRRLHDINRSGWWLLLLFVFGYFVLLYWFLQPSQKETAELF